MFALGAIMLSLGGDLYRGSSSHSLNGASGVATELRLESENPRLAPWLAIDGHYSGGAISLPTETPPSTLYAFGAQMGSDFFPLYLGGSRLFVGAGAGMRSFFLKMSSLSGSSDKATHSVSPIFSAEGGLDLQLRGSAGTKNRAQTLRLGVMAETSNPKLAGQAPLEHRCLRVFLGIRY